MVSKVHYLLIYVGWLVSICMLLFNLTLVLFFVPCVIWEVTLVEDCYTSQLLLCASLVLVITIGLEVTLLDSPLLLYFCWW
jgi:hypothetical protein